MRFSLAVFVLALIVSGCASVPTQTISPQDQSSLQGQSLVLTSRKMPDFGAMTPTKAALGIFGAAAAISSGNEIISTNNVPDPADAIATGLSKLLMNVHSVKMVATPVAVTSDDVSDIASAADQSANYVLDVKSMVWETIYFPTNWTHYRVLYTAKARLIDVHKKSVVAQGFCKVIPDTDESAPSYDDMLANQATVLKQMMDKDVQTCIDTFKSELLALH